MTSPRLILKNAAAPSFSATSQDTVLFSGRISDKRKNDICSLFLKLGIPAPQDSAAYGLINRSLTAPSGASERLKSNQRLEYLGDAVMTAVVRDYLVRRYDHLNEGDLTQLSSILACNRVLTVIGNRMGLEPFIKYNREQVIAAKTREKMVADTVEALCGALFTADKGNTRHVKTMLIPYIREAINEIPFDRLSGPGAPDTATLARELWPLESDAIAKAAAQARKKKKK